MGLKSEEKSIGDSVFRVTQWNATKAMIMKIKLLKYFGDAFKEGISNSGSIPEKLMASLGTVISNVDEVEFIKFIKELACSAIRDGERMNTARFDEYFLDNFAEAYEVAFFVVEVNYKDFLEYVLNLLKEKSN